MLYLAPCTTASKGMAIRQPHMKSLPSDLADCLILSHARLYIGRDPKPAAGGQRATLPADLYNVSMKHANAVALSDSQVEVIDTSTNGTYFCKHGTSQYDKMLKGTPTVLEVGDFIEFGGHQPGDSGLRFTVQVASAAHKAFLCQTPAENVSLPTCRSCKKHAAEKLAANDDLRKMTSKAVDLEAQLARSAAEASQAKEELATTKGENSDIVRQLKTKTEQLASAEVSHRRALDEKTTELDAVTQQLELTKADFATAEAKRSELQSGRANDAEVIATLQTTVESADKHAEELTSALDSAKRAHKEEEARLIAQLAEQRAAQDQARDEQLQDQLASSKTREAALEDQIRAKDKEALGWRLKVERVQATVPAALRGALERRMTALTEDVHDCIRAALEEVHDASTSEMIGATPTACAVDRAAEPVARPDGSQPTLGGTQATQQMPEASQDVPGAAADGSNTQDGCGHSLSLRHGFGGSAAVTVERSEPQGGAAVADGIGSPLLAPHGTDRSGASAALGKRGRATTDGPGSETVPALGATSPLAAPRSQHASSDDENRGVNGGSQPDEPVLKKVCASTEGTSADEAAPVAAAAPTSSGIDDLEMDGDVVPAASPLDPGLSELKRKLNGMNENEATVID